MFKGNLKRIQALSTSEQFLERIRGHYSTVRSTDDLAIDDQQFDLILEMLEAAQKYYERDNCNWGIGLVYFH